MRCYTFEELKSHERKHKHWALSFLGRQYKLFKRERDWRKRKYIGDYAYLNERKIGMDWQFRTIEQLCDFIEVKIGKERRKKYEILGKRTET
jgi:hypothetical protein